MGCTSGMFAPYTAQDIDQELAKITPRLPVAELMNGGVIKLEGANGVFNPNSLLDPSWLKGKMTIEEYMQAIYYINQCAGYSHIGLSKIYSTSERAMRLNLSNNAGIAAVQQLNQRYTSVRFTYQQTAEDMLLNTSYETDRMIRYAQRNQAPVAHASKTVLYITVN
jgi:hypothetical protein